MGNALVCFEGGEWHSHHHIHRDFHAEGNRGGITQDMSQPLSHYFVSSGHNSYLEGNQLTSVASSNTIEHGLKQGCRVIELDVYDGPKGEPVCTHGGTLTSTVTFGECVKVIARHGFSASPYPVILTIENHAGTEQQGVMAQLLHSHLGGRLFEPTPEQRSSAAAWLSPEQLKEKVLIRMKVKEGSTNPDLERLVYIRNSKIVTFDVTAGPAVPGSHSVPETKLPSPPEYGPFKRLADSVSATKSIRSSLKRKASNAKSQGLDAAAAEVVAKEDDTALLQDASAKVETGAAAAAAAAGGGGAAAAGGASLTRSTSGVSARASNAVSDARDVEEDDQGLETDDGSICDLPSASAAAASLLHPSLYHVLRYTAKHLLRVYPSGKRMLDNSNPDPAPSWAVGASLAALNWQLADEPMWVNEAFFARQDGCGYILKPDWMRTCVPPGGLPPRQPRTLAVHVYSAHKFQGRKMGMYKDDPYVELKIHGIPCDCGVARTNHVYDSGRLVVEQTYRFPVSFPEMAVLLVLLKDMDVGTVDPVHGYAALPLETLAEGEYQLRLTKPYRMGAKPEGKMWVKVKLAWESPAGGAAAGAAGDSTAAAAAAGGGAQAAAEATG